MACKANEKEKRERLARYICRPAVALNRLSINGQGQVVYKLKTPYSNGTTHMVYSQLEFIEKLVALVPRPRINLIRFAGVFAPHSKHRSKIVPKPRKKTEKEERQTPSSTAHDEEETE
ncbi:transposase, partial [Bdellovibrionales bacterium]|nr:transposase [Bdellovibrionales bacterium]